jgi:hypothetical protein
MPLQNENEFNSKEFNSFFAPRGSIVAKQVASKEELLAKESRIRPDGASGSSGLLVQNSLSEEPVSFSQRNVGNISVVTAEKKWYRDLYYCMSKTVNYLRMHKTNQFSPTGEFIQSVINTPKTQAIRSKTNASEDLKKVYDMQFYLNTGPTGNAFLEELSEPLPGAVGVDEFVKRLDPAGAEAEVLRNMARMGFVDTDFNPLSSDTEQAAAPQTRSLTIRDTTPLEEKCNGRS